MFVAVILYTFIPPTRASNEGGWVGQWCWVASSGGRQTTLAYSKEEACCACSRCGTGGPFFCVFFFISSILSSFSNASSLGRRLDILNYRGLGRCNPTVAVSYYWRRARLVLVNHLVGLSLPRNSVNG